MNRKNWDTFQTVLVCWTKSWLRTFNSISFLNFQPAWTVGRNCEDCLKFFEWFGAHRRTLFMMISVLNWETGGYFFLAPEKQKWVVVLALGFEFSRTCGGQVWFSFTFALEKGDMQCFSYFCVCRCYFRRHQLREDWQCWEQMVSIFSSMPIPNRMPTSCDESLILYLLGVLLSLYFHFQVSVKAVFSNIEQVGTLPNALEYCGWLSTFDFMFLCCTAEGTSPPLEKLLG